MELRVYRKDEFVTYNSNTKKTICLRCGLKYKSYIFDNIKKHYKLKHNVIFEKGRSPSCAVTKAEGSGLLLVSSDPTLETPNDGGFEMDIEYQATTPITKVNKEETSATEAGTTSNVEDTAQSLVNIANSQIKIEIELKKSEFLKCCVGLVTVANLPITIFDDVEFFKRLIGPYEEKFNLNLNSTNINVIVDSWALRSKSILSGKFHQKLLSLKIDVVRNRLENCAMVINIEYMECYRLVTYTIGVVPLTENPTVQWLRDAIMKCLQEFGINWSQLYSTTSDNSDLVMQALNLINHTSAAEQDGSAGATKSVPFILSFAYQTIQLAVSEYFTTIESSLRECRQRVEMINDKYGQSQVTKLPSLDNTSRRWESTFNMVSSLNEFIRHNELDITIECTFVDSFIEALTPLLQCSQKLESAQYLIGDFYRDWLVCEAKLRKKSHNEHASTLLNAMKDFKQKLLYNETFNAALYFDPRFNYLDSPYFSYDRKKLAVDHILKTATFLNELEFSGGMTTTNDYAIENPTATYICAEDEIYNILEEELHTISKHSSGPRENLVLRQKLEKLAYSQRLPYSAKILDYWKNQPFKDHEVHSALTVCLAVPITQTTNETAASILSTVLSKQKSDGTDENLSNMLMLKLNGNILKDIQN